MQTQTQTALPALTPLGQAATAGPWSLSVIEVATGSDAAARIASANAGNSTAPDGVGYLLAHVQATNTGATPLVLNMADFTATGSDGVLRPAASLAGPTPELQGTVAAGATIDGWLPLLVDDPTAATLWFESILLGGDWSSAILGITDQAAIPTFDPAAAPDTNAGSDPASPAAVGTAVRAGDWAVTVIRTGNGQEVYDNSDYGLRALAQSAQDQSVEISTWLGVYLRVTNLSARPANFSPNALMLCDTDGEVWDNVMALNAPAPDVARRLVPGATREGWAAFQLKPYSPGTLARVAPSVVADAPRYVSLSGSAATGTTTSTSPAGTPVALDVVAGDTVVTTDSEINLRSEPSPTGQIVAELAKDTQLTGTGDAVEAGGYTWYPVTVVATGDAGYVVSTFLAKAP
ncbi:MAG: hypothetical protein ACTHMX_11365 [Thermomicrobiales bacterium]